MTIIHTNCAGKKQIMSYCVWRRCVCKAGTGLILDSIQTWVCYKPQTCSLRGISWSALPFITMNILDHPSVQSGLWISRRDLQKQVLCHHRLSIKDHSPFCSALALGLAGYGEPPSLPIHSRKSSSSTQQQQLPPSSWRIFPHKLEETNKSAAS